MYFSRIPCSTMSMNLRTEFAASWPVTVVVILAKEKPADRA